MSFHRFGPGRIGLALIVLSAITCLANPAFADDLPASVAALLPDGLEQKEQSWGVFKGEEEFEGTQFDGSMFALFPGSVSCDYTIGPEFRLELKGSTAWEASPEQLEMFVQMYVPEYEVEAGDLAGNVKSRLGDYNVNGSSGEFALGEAHDEQLSNGHIVYVDFTWKCDKNPAGKNVLLEGFARRKATILTFAFWANGGTAEARAMAVGILDRFEKLDLEALIR